MTAESGSSFRHPPFATAASLLHQGKRGRQSLDQEQIEPSFQLFRLSPPETATVGFDRRELQAILNLYGRMVAQGVWRDYAMDFSPHRAIFSIFRRTGEAAFYRIVKEPKLARKQGAYSVVAQTGLILKRGPDLQRVLAAIEKKPLAVV
jgi:hypothetical protein